MKMEKAFGKLCLLLTILLLSVSIPAWGAKVENPAKPEVKARLSASPIFTVPGSYFVSIHISR